MSLRQLIHQCKKQDLKAQEELYRQYSARFFALCLKYSGNYEEAKDLLQDGFLKIFSNVNQYNGSGSFEGWMSRIFINTALKKSKKRHLFLALDEDRAEEIEVEVDADLLTVDFLIDLIQQLPEAYRNVFNLFVLEGHSHREIAALLEITQGTSKSNLARARQQLRQKIETHLNQNSARSL